MTAEKKKIYLANAFSINMLEDEGLVAFDKIDVEEAKKTLENGFDSAIGHEGTAKFLSELLGVEVPTDRKMIKLSEDSVLIVAQLKQRLPEGKTLTKEEVMDMYNKGLVEFWKVELRGKEGQY